MSKDPTPDARDEWLKLAEQFDRPPTPNPWPENSDYGKFWRRGYEAGKFDAHGRSIANAFRARAALMEQSR
jgi:hypothetical protein